MILSRNFYERDTATVSAELLGKVLVHHEPEGLTSGKIVETEAYYGEGDPASRASQKKTGKNEIMWGSGGFAYVYMVHGHWLFNVVSEREGTPGAVLIRALEPIEGKDLMGQRRGKKDRLELTSGPGKLTQALGITKNHHGTNLTTSEELNIVEKENQKFKIETSHRIGVSSDLQQELRFFISGSEFVSQ